MLLTTLLNSQDLSNLWNASVYMHIYYLLEKQTAVQPAIIYLWCHYLIMEMVKQTAVQPVSTWKIALHNKNHAIKRGLGQKNHAVKKLQRIRNEKCVMCAWDHWNSIGANPVRYRCKFATSKMPQIRAMCVMTLKECIVNLFNGTT